MFPDKLHNKVPEAAFTVVLQRTVSSPSVDNLTVNNLAWDVAPEASIYW